MKAARTPRSPASPTPAEAKPRAPPSASGSANAEPAPEPKPQPVLDELGKMRTYYPRSESQAIGFHFDFAAQAAKEVAEADPITREHLQLLEQVLLILLLGQKFILQLAETLTQGQEVKDHQDKVECHKVLTHHRGMIKQLIYLILVEEELVVDQINMQEHQEELLLED